MPYRKKKSWISFIKKAQAANLKNYGTKTVIRNSKVEQSWTDLVDYQGTASVTLYGKRGTDNATNTGNRDVFDITSQEPNFNEVTEKIMFTSGVLDITFHNTGNTKLEVDLYQIVFAGRGNNGVNIKQDFQDAVQNTKELDGAAQTEFLATRGLTPFDVTAALARGYKIQKKVKYFCSAGEVFTYQLRDPKNFMLSGYSILTTEDTGESAYNWKTKFLFFVVKQVPVFGSEQSSGAYSIGCTRSYKYKVIADNQDNLEFI